MLGDAVLVEGVDGALILLDAVDQVWGDLAQVGGDGALGILPLDDELVEVLVEDVAHDLDQQVGFAVQQRGRLHRLQCSADLGPLGGQSADIQGELFLGGTLGRRAHDDAGILGKHLLEDLLEASTLGVRQLARNPVHRTVGNVDEVATGKRNLTREPGPLVADRILGDLHEHLVAGLQRELDAARLALSLAGVLCGSIPVDLTGVQHGIAAAPDVDEGRLHAGQHVLHAAQVDIPDERRIL